MMSLSEPLPANAPQQEDFDGPETRKCRICLQQGGDDLIQPCLCKGSVKWVHRHCLDHWRSRGQGSRTFTHCPNCQFAYLMELQRADTELERNMRERRRRILRTAVGHFFLGLLLTQLLLCSVALFIRALDPEEALVDLLPLWSPILPGEAKQSFLSTFRYHKATYYVASLIICLAIVGLSVLVHSCLPGRRRTVGGDCIDVCCAQRCGWPVRTHGHNCSLGCLDCCDCLDGCDNCLPRGNSSNSEGGGGGGGGGNVGLIVFVVVMILLALVGIFFLLAALVMWVQKVWSRYLALKELRVLVEEYVVKDLSKLEQDMESQAEPDMTPSAPVWVPMMPQEVQSNLYRDLQAVYMSSAFA